LPRLVAIWWISSMPGFHAGRALKTGAAARRSFAGRLSNAARASELSRKRRRGSMRYSMPPFSVLFIRKSLQTRPSVPRSGTCEFTEAWRTYHYKSEFNGRLGDLAVRPVCLQPLFANGAYTSMRMRNKSYADNSSLTTDSQVLQSPPAWASIIPPDCALVEFL